MTDTSGKNTELIEPDADIIYEKLNYAGFGDQADILFGPECEFFICKEGNGTLLPIGIEEAEEFKAYFEEKTGVPLHQEAIASHFELNYGPMDLENFREKFEDYFDNVKALYRIADEKGYRVIPSSHAPHIEGADDIMDQLVARERIRVLIPEIRKYMGNSLIKFANLTAGIHVSSGYKSPVQLFTDMRRTYYLSPFIYAVSNNGFPFWQGMKPADGIIPRLAAIEEFANDPQGRGRTGIDPLFYEARDGVDMLKSYIGRILNSTTLGYRAKTRTLKEIFRGKSEPGLRPMSELGASPENPMSFTDFKRKELNTIANLQFAASLWWYGVKIQDLPLEGENGEPLKRFEDRVWNAGTWQISTALLVRTLTTRIPACGIEVDNLLEKYGFSIMGPSLDRQAGEFLKEATNLAWKTGGSEGLNFKYGHGTAQDFGREFVAILKKYAKKYGLEDYLEPMEYIVRTNRTDSRVLYDICRTPDDVVKFVANYDINQLVDPRRCFGMLQDEGNLPNPAAERTSGRQYPEPESGPDSGRPQPG